MAPHLLMPEDTVIAYDRRRACTRVKVTAAGALRQSVQDKMLMVPDLTTLVLFVMAAGVLLVMPGPAVIYIITRTLDQGRLAGLVSVLGIGVGTLLHVAAAALGLSALLRSFALAFDLVKYLGAAYLTYLGLRTLLRDDSVTRTAREAPSDRLQRVFAEGVLVNALNPKTALFFLAFLPQFVDPARGAVEIQVLLLGLLLVVMGLVSDGSYALAAGAVAPWLQAAPRSVRARRYCAGCVYLALGVSAALSQRTAR
ncbi:MAG: LysE family translocator [Vicinamibacteraceae bacterium]